MISDERLKQIANPGVFSIAKTSESEEMAKELLALRKAADKFRVQGVQIVIEKNQQARERMFELANFDDYEPYLDGLDDACQQIIREIESGTLPDKFKKPYLPE